MNTLSGKPQADLVGAHNLMQPDFCTLMISTTLGLSRTRKLKFLWKEENKFISYVKGRLTLFWSNLLSLVIYIVVI